MVYRLNGETGEEQVGLVPHAELMKHWSELERLGTGQSTTLINTEDFRVVIITRVR